MRGYERNIELDKFIEKREKIKIEIKEEEGKPVTGFVPKIALSILQFETLFHFSCENWKTISIGVRELVIDRLGVRLCFFYAFLYYFKCKSGSFIHILLNM